MHLSNEASPQLGQLSPIGRRGANKGAGSISLAGRVAQPARRLSAAPRRVPLGRRSFRLPFGGGGCGARRRWESARACRVARTSRRPTFGGGGGLFAAPASDAGARNKAPTAAPPTDS